MKRTYQIQQEMFYEVLKKIQDEFGFPYYYEELVLYMQNVEASAKVVVESNRGMHISYRDFDGYEKVSVSLESGELKHVIVLLKNVFGCLGHISVSPAFCFNLKQHGVQIKMVKRSLIGPIITVEGSNTEVIEFVENQECVAIGQNVQQEEIPQETIIDYSISATGILNDKILSYAERNGVYLKKEQATTYKDVLQAKTNDYTEYARVFASITGKELLSTIGDSREILKQYCFGEKISIVIPCFNSNDSIVRVLDSIASQVSLPEDVQIDVVVVDDGSREHVDSILSAQKYLFNLQIIRCQKNVGLSTARMLGADAAKGDFLVFLDSDILLEKNYLAEHLLRNLIIPNAVFVSFKENVDSADSRISDVSIEKGLEKPDYSRDLRIHKRISKGATGSYDVTKDLEVNILESTNYFMSFNGSRNFGVYDLSCMVIGHNFSLRRETLTNIKPFTRSIAGWGMEDVYLGLKLIKGGNYIIPVLSSGVFHIDHEPRSGSAKTKQMEYERNTQIINQFLNFEIEKDL